MIVRRLKARRSGLIADKALTRKIAALFWQVMVRDAPNAEEFFDFSVLVPWRNEEPSVVKNWREVTSTTPTSACQPGTGKSFGWLVLDVLREMRAKPD